MSDLQAMKRKLKNKPKDEAKTKADMLVEFARDDAHLLGVARSTAVYQRLNRTVIGNLLIFQFVDKSFLMFESKGY